MVPDGRPRGARPVGAWLSVEQHRWCVLMGLSLTSTQRTLIRLALEETRDPLSLVGLFVQMGLTVVGVGTVLAVLGLAMATGGLLGGLAQGDPGLAWTVAQRGGWCVGDGVRAAWAAHALGLTRVLACTARWAPGAQRRGCERLLARHPDALQGFERASLREVLDGSGDGSGLDGVNDSPGARRRRL